MIDYKILNSLLDTIVSFKEIYSKYNATLNFSINENSLFISILQKSKKVDHQFSMSKNLNQDLTLYCNSSLDKLQKGEL